MAISKDTIEGKIDELVVKKEVQSAVFEEQPVDTPEPTEQAVAEEDGYSELLLEPTPDVTATPEQVEEVKVAGLASKAKGVAEFIGKKVAKAEEAAEKSVVPPAPREQIFEAGGTYVVREAPVEDAQQIIDMIDGDYDKGINFLNLADDFSELDVVEFMEATKKSNADLFERARRGTLNFEALKEMADRQGMSKIVDDWMKREPGTPAAAEDLLAGVIAIKALAGQTLDAFSTARALPDGVERQAALSSAKKVLTMYAAMTANVSAAGSEAARSMYALRMAGEKLGMDSLNIKASQLEDLLGNPNAQDLEFLGEAFMALPNEKARASFAKQSLFAKTSDVIVEIWINSILSSIPTHMVNIVGNAGFMMYRAGETAVAGGIGKVRTSVTGSKDRVFADEALVELNAMKNASLNALIVAGRTLRTEEASDLASKIDVRNRRAIGTTGDPKQIINQIRNGNITSALVNTVGSYTRLGGRFLIAEDEFFKAIMYRSSLERTAHVRGRQTYDQAIASGKTVEEAGEMAQVEQLRILEEPPQDVVDSAQAFAREGTFQGDLDGVMAKAQGFSQYPIVKLFVPFLKTPTNIMKETLKRSPVMLAHPSFYRKLAAGGREADTVMAQVGTGSAIMGTFAMLSMGGGEPSEYPPYFITGSGPVNRKAQQAMARLGIQRYAVNIRQEDGTYKSIPYSRLDPMSGMLAMSSDFAYYAQYSDDENELNALAMAATLGIAEYTLQNPFLQGVSELSGVLAADNPADAMSRIGELLGQKVTEAGLSTIPTVSAMGAAVERKTDTTKRSTMLPAGKSSIPGFGDMDITDLPAPMRGFYTALARAKARNPIFSKDVPPQYNLWGEERKEGDGTMFEFFSPIRVKDTKYSPVDVELLELGDGPGMPSKKIDGVLLNRDQYNELLLTAANMDNAANMPGDIGYNPTQALLPVFNALINSPAYKSLPTKMDKADALKNIYGKRASAARKLLMQNNPDLNFKVKAKP